MRKSQWPVMMMLITILVKMMRLIDAIPESEGFLGDAFFLLFLEFDYFYVFGESASFKIWHIFTENQWRNNL